jgi:anaerobic magnesium-protoporphyrin IX monomethyl ester cyclase
MSRILLVNAPHDDESEEIRRFSRPWPPLDLLNCAAILRQHGHEIELLDYRSHPIDSAARDRASAAADRILVTTTPLDRWQCPTLNTSALFRFIRGFPSEKTFISGTHGTMRPEWMLKETGAAGVVLGEPEGAMANLAESASLAGAPGFAVMENGALRSERLPPLDLTQLPIPAWDLLEVRRYRYELLGSRFLLFEAARGCPFGCTFCSREMYGKPVRRKQTAQVLAEIADAQARTHFRSAYFIDLEFTFHREPIVELCEGLLSRNLRFTWACQTRLDQVDEQLLRLMRRAGCKLIHLGVESGAAKWNKALKKGIPLEKILAQHALVKRCGFETALFFLIGHPGETPDEQRETIAFALKLDPTYASFHIVSPYPGTVFHEKSAPYEEPFPSFDAHHHRLADLEAMRRHALRRFYLRPSVVAHAFRPSNIARAARGLRLFLRMTS